jgi:hypothetical protein
MRISRTSLMIPKGYQNSKVRYEKVFGDEAYWALLERLRYKEARALFL